MSSQPLLRIRARTQAYCFITGARVELKTRNLQRTSAAQAHRGTHALRPCSTHRPGHFAASFERVIHPFGHIAHEVVHTSGEAP